MTGYLKRLGSSLVAYQLGDTISKIAAIALLRVYTHYIPPSRYAVVNVIAYGVIFFSIVIRFGMIEAFLRFYFSDEEQARRDALARRATGFLLITTTVAVLPTLALAAPLSKLIFGYRDAPTFAIGLLGLWTFTNLELAYGLLRVQERRKAYAVASVTNVVVTIALSVVLVVAAKMGARGVLLANYGTSTVVLFALWFAARHRLVRRRAAPDALPELLRFGLPTVPAEASAYLMSIADQYFLYIDRSHFAAGVYGLAVKVAGAVAFIVRAFQYAWPPLAYSVTDDAEAARLYGLVTTYYVACSGLVVAGLSLFARWIVHLLASNPGYFGATPAVTWVCLGWAMYGLFVVFLSIAGRAKVTTRNFPAALCGLVANVGLLFALVPPFGLAGAGIALSGAYLVMLIAMHLFTRNLFTVAFEWRRLAQLVVVIGGITATGDLALPDHGAAAFAARALALAAIPVALLLTRFASAAELRRLRLLVARLRPAT
jgi:O-antigen/teichoic acid export membrane protein